MQNSNKSVDNEKKPSIEEIYTFCKRKGFVFKTSEIYGGIAGFFDYGPLGVELKNNIKNLWWKTHVRSRSDVVGINGSIITHPKVWVASGHTKKFSDVIVQCTSCKQRFRADQLVEEKTGLNVDGYPAEKIDEIILKEKIRCPRCGGKLSKPMDFNLMFKTYVGPSQTQESIAYLRPETAQLIFSNFKLVLETSRQKLPFGIAQIGKAFRNEISPRNFLFRCREFEQAEIEYFVNKNEIGDCPYFEEFRDYKLLLLSSEDQQSGKDAKIVNLGKAFDNNIIVSKWLAYWIGFEHKFIVSLGIKPENLRVRQHLPSERAHYASDTWDIEYKFPFGWREIEGIADRTTYDLSNHMKTSGEDLRYYDEKTGEKIIPYVAAEPSLGLDRLFLALLFEAYQYNNSRKNIVLKLDSKISPFKVAVFPLLSNNKQLVELSRDVFSQLSKHFSVFFDKSGSIGRRYARQDEIGTPYCVTVDFDSLKNKDVTIRFRDTAEQVRIKISELKQTIEGLVSGELNFDDLVKEQSNKKNL